MSDNFTGWMKIFVYDLPAYIFNYFKAFFALLFHPMQTLKNILRKKYLIYLFSYFHTICILSTLDLKYYKINPIYCKRRYLIYFFNTL